LGPPGSPPKSSSVGIPTMFFPLVVLRCRRFDFSAFLELFYPCQCVGIPLSHRRGFLFFLGARPGELLPCPLFLLWWFFVGNVDSPGLVLRVLATLLFFPMPQAEALSLFLLRRYTKTLLSFRFTFFPFFPLVPLPPSTTPFFFFFFFFSLLLFPTQRFAAPSVPLVPLPLLPPYHCTFP